MTNLMISDFKARCLAVIEKVHATGEPVLITRRGKPLARVIPVTECDAKPRRLGALTGEATVHGDIVHFSAGDDWENLR